MPRPKTTIVNAETGEIIERELDDAELAQWELDKANAAARAEAELATAESKTALLNRLGITADEAKLLFS